MAHDPEDLAELADPFRLDEEGLACVRCGAPTSAGFDLDGLRVPLCNGHRAIAQLAELLDELEDLRDRAPGGGTPPPVG